MVEGVFARAFRSELRPVELGRRLVREMDDHRSIDVQGRTVVPNAFTITLSQADDDTFRDIHDLLVRELGEAARAYARDEGYSFVGPVEVTLVVDPKLKRGSFDVDGRLKEGPTTSGAGAASLVLPDGERVSLDDATSTIGRLPECAVTLGDPGVSRRHAELRRSTDGGFVLVDLGSTNGTRVNGVVVGEHRLTDGDEITVGNTRLRFETT